MGEGGGSVGGSPRGIGAPWVFIATRNLGRDDRSAFSWEARFYGLDGLTGRVALRHPPGWLPFLMCDLWSLLSNQFKIIFFLFNSKMQDLTKNENFDDKWNTEPNDSETKV